MTVIVVAGSRSITDPEPVRRAIEDADLAFGPTEKVIHGGARGVDTRADGIARGMGFDVEVFEVTDEEWDKFGPAAGPKRNSRMVDRADALAAVWDGESSGTEDTIEKALGRGLDVLVRQPWTE